jgi:hypothetical protein
MGFLIQEKLEKKDSVALKNEFDPEAYNYMINRSTCFMDGDFTRKENDVLENALKNLDIQDTRNLGII